MIIRIARKHAGRRFRGSTKDDDDRGPKYTVRRYVPMTSSIALVGCSIEASVSKMSILTRRICCHDL